MTTDQLIIVQSLFIPILIEDVWEFITDEAKMMNWFQAEKFTIDYWAGGEIEIPYNFEGLELTIIGEIGLVYPPEKFEFTWHERTGTNEEWFNNTMVRIHLEKEGDGTHFKLTHDGFKYLPEEIRAKVHQRYSKYWTESGIFVRLQALILEGRQ